MIDGRAIPSTGVPTNYMQYASQNPFLSALKGGFGGYMQALHFKEKTWLEF